jgi:class 3 adenylate cyclase/pimeloyl-ACP methyl ester carboxylesterase
MEQDIRFCKTSDGVRIAYASVGHGPPLIRALGWATHLEYEWQSPLWRHFIEALAQHHTLIRYDGRGTGLSDRDVEVHSVEQWATDLEAVADAAGYERFDILGISQGGSTAVTYALRHPERVSHLILYGSFARWFHPADTEEAREIGNSILTLIRVGWGQANPAFRAMFASAFVPGASAEQQRWFDDLSRNSCSADNAVKLMEAFAEIDVTASLAALKVPTLVMHRRGDAAVPFEAGREFASMVPNARFVPLEGDNHLYLDGEPGIQDFIRNVEEFLGTAPARAGDSAVAQSGLVTILFTDMEGSTTQTQRLGDAAAQEVLRMHNKIIRDALKEHGGSEVKHTGDGVMASFGSARSALGCAVDIQRGLADTDGIRVRIGLNAGEPIAEEQDLFGSSVQLAARVCAKAEAGQILVSNVVRELAMGKGFLFSDIGDVVLKGFEDPVRLYEVPWRDAS